MDSVYPQLYLYCKQRGYDFRMIDLRRGVEDPVTDHHDSVELHLEMLKMCQETEGPNFFVSVSEELFMIESNYERIPFFFFYSLNFPAVFPQLFTGQKHEFQSLPTKISQKDFEAILKIVIRDRERVSNRQSDLQETPTETQSSTSREPERPKMEENYSYGEDKEEACLARSWADYDRDLTLLLTWYRLDENTLPPVYRLLPVRYTGNRKLFTSYS